MAAIAGRAAWDHWVEQARSADLLATAQAYGARLKKSGTAEWEGPCLVCGGTDRFSINIKKKVFNCRKCGGTGDVIAFVGWFHGSAPVEAMETINGTPRPDRSRDETLEQRNSRLAWNAKHRLDLQRQEEERRAAEAAKAKRDEEAIAAILKRAKAIPDTYGWEYLRGRGLNPARQLVGDIRFVPDLDYWGVRDNGTREIVHLATLPAVIALIRDFSGAVIGLSQTYLDPKEPRKWTPEGSPSNSPTKIRGEKKHGHIRLGMLSETIAIAEGWANALAFHQLGYGPEGMALLAAVDLGNLAGGSIGTVGHPVLKDADGRQRRMKSGDPDPAAPGIILPDDEIKSIILIADRDSESYSTAAQLRTAGNRFVAMGLQVEIAWPDAGKDWNDLLIAMESDVGGASGSGSS